MEAGGEGVEGGYGGGETGEGTEECHDEVREWSMSESGGEQGETEGRGC